MDTILLLGSGGREDTIAWALSRSSNVERIVVVPGNPAMTRHNKVECRSGRINDTNFLVELAREIAANLVIIGPEKPIVNGISDAFRVAGFAVAAPSQAAGQLEASKIHSKYFMQEVGIPTAEFSEHQSYEAAKIGLQNWDFSDGIVVKSDALAGGKGVVLCDTLEEAEKVIFDFMKNPKISVQTDHILFEKKLKGREVSAFAALDGESVYFLGTACDHKRVYDNDKGPNTGGMGTFSPADWLSPLALAKIQRIFEQVAEGMRSRGTPYQGILFAGLMVDGDEPSIIEFNIRLGDPETQALLPTLDGDVHSVFRAIADGRLADLPALKTTGRSAVHVVLASEGYPSIDGTPLNTGHTIAIPGTVPVNTHIFYAGVKQNEHGLIINSGGRVLGVTALANSLDSARSTAYGLVKEIHFNGMHYRSDIGLHHA